MARIGLFLKGTAWLLGLSLLLLLVWVAINWRDEELTPEAKQFLAAPPNSLNPKENLYLALMGSSAPEGQSPVIAGLKRVEEHEARAAEALKDPLSILHPDVIVGELKFRGRIDFCEPLRESCLRGIEKHRT